MNEFKTKLASILRADTALRAMLSKVTSPYGIYFVKPPEKPVFPLVTYKVIGGGVNDSGREAQVRNIVLVVSAYSRTNANAILGQVKRTLNEPVSFTGMTTCKVEQIILESGGADEFDNEFQVYARSNRYRVWLRKKPTA